MAIKKPFTTDDVQVDESPKDTPAEVKVRSPLGSVTTVPAGLVDVLVESGYKVEK